MKRYDTVDGKTVIGIYEPVTLHTDDGADPIILTKIDTGATKSSVDAKLAEDLKLGPIISTKVIKSALGNKRRPIVELEVTLAGKMIKAEFTIADRSNLSYKMLIGQNILKQGFLIDPQL